MSINAIWIAGSSRSGKTTRLVEQFCQWATDPKKLPRSQPPKTLLVFAANGDNRIELADRLTTATHGQQSFVSATPLGFFQDEVTLFLPIVAEKLRIKGQFPLRLRPETEQELATRLWQEAIAEGRLCQDGITDYYMVRRSLDLLQLAAMAGIAPEQIPVILQDGLTGQDGLTSAAELWEAIGTALTDWRQWCLDRGLLTYGLITELYWRYLLPDATYQQQLCRRYQAVLADDVDEYPAIARLLFDCLLDHGLAGAFTYNADGATRWGLGADPVALSALAARCQVETLEPPARSLGAVWGQTLVGWVQSPMILPELPSSMQLIQTVSRAQLLRQTAAVITDAILSRQVEPQDVAVIGPGLDAIARYTLREILSSRGIAVESLSDQQPLVSSPIIRALLTLLALVYPGLGRLVNRESVSEMLVVLSLPPMISTESGLDLARIDPVRAGLITDHCFVPDPEQPKLLAATHFPRWDRLGYQATYVYGEIVQWIEVQQQQQQQRLIASPVVLLDRAIQRFLFGGSHLPYDQLAVLRELMETAQHYWEVDARLRQSERQSDRLEQPASVTVEQFIQLLRNGTITADPYPIRPVGFSSNAVTLATIFQYRSARRAHRWQFWLDAGSPLWLTGGGALFGAPLMLQAWTGRPWTAADALESDQQRLRRQLLDLLYRVEDRVYLCCSDLSTGGQEQAGPLVSLVNAIVATGAPV